ncbi:hypothetical protein AV545_09035 [Paenibacillus jamilae]|uniref:hypothetical protein n=1 Tax=Paenibacillus jamilae TaxID=114136 RepID=UPI0007AC0EC2|nr:hypothetical protein [Paenibacillus jamilae]KZE81614.1 hypothetical protein AV545_09035 [Paenibacillus jamilae]
MDRFKVVVKGFPEHLKDITSHGKTIPWHGWKSLGIVSCYYFAYKIEYGCIVPLYVGHTQNLKQRVPTICNQSCKAHNEATHITYFEEKNKRSRIRNRDKIADFFCCG